MRVKTLSTRAVVRLALALLAVAVAAILALLGGFLADTASGNAAGAARQVPWMLGLAAAAAAIAVAAAWAVIERTLAAREHFDRNLPPRPEFYDFEFLNQPMHLHEFEGRRLKSLNYLVFDTETTGLRPSQGDEIISIAGVRIEDGRILTDDAYSVLVNPGRRIPRASIRFHGITDEMVADAPPICEVLPGFRDFIGDAVLVAHNAAFDMKFLSLKEKPCTVTFDHVVLDTLLLSVFLDNHTQEHTLDAITKRYGVDVEGRHTAIGDALATAGVFLRMLDMLEVRGVDSLYKAHDISRNLIEIRKMQERF